LSFSDVVQCRSPHPPGSSRCSTHRRSSRVDRTPTSDRARSAVGARTSQRPRRRLHRVLARRPTTLRPMTGFSPPNRHGKFVGVTTPSGASRTKTGFSDGALHSPHRGRERSACTRRLPVRAPGTATATDDLLRVTAFTFTTSPCSANRSPATQHGPGRRAQITGSRSIASCSLTHRLPRCNPTSHEHGKREHCPTATNARQQFLIPSRGHRCTTDAVDPTDLVIRSCFYTDSDATEQLVSTYKSDYTRTSTAQSRYPTPISSTPPISPG